MNTTNSDEKTPGGSSSSKSDQFRVVGSSDFTSKASKGRSQTVKLAGRCEEVGSKEDLQDYDDEDEEEKLGDSSGTGGGGSSG